MEKINALIEKLQELKNSNAGLQTISYYVQLLQAEVLHTRNAQLQQKNTQTNIAVILPSDRMASHNTLPPSEVPAPVAEAAAPAPPVAEHVPAPAAPAPVAPENIPAPAMPAPAASADNIPAPPPAAQQPKEEAKPVILHIPKLVAAYTPPVIKHPPPPAPEAPVHTTPTPAAEAAVPTPEPPAPEEPVHTAPAPAAAVPTPAQVPPPAEHIPAATYTPPAAAMPAANHTVPTAPPVAVPAPAATAQPAPQVPKPTPATLFDTTAAPAHHNGHRQEQPAENHNIRKELNELVGQTQSGTSLNERLRTANVEVAEKLREMGVKDLRDAIGINDKFQFIQELFRGDRDMYDRSVKTINECTSLQEAEYWIQRELKIYQGWQDEDTLVKHFYSLVKKRFS